MSSFGIPAHGVRDLKSKVALHLRELAAEALDNDNVDLGLAARIADSLWSLIEVTEDGPPAARDAVRGAIDYFVLNRDEIPDLDDPDGFVDDAEVVNQVCMEFGYVEMTIRIPASRRRPAVENPPD